jgi:hypothetical protein
MLQMLFSDVAHFSSAHDRKGLRPGHSGELHAGLQGKVTSAVSSARGRRGLRPAGGSQSQRGVVGTWVGPTQGGVDRNLSSVISTFRGRTSGDASGI